MGSTTDIRNHSPGDLAQAWGRAHWAAQLLTKAACAILEPEPDDVLSLTAITEELPVFLNNGFDLGRRQLGLER